MLRVGLTGSIAVGKSFVASVFTELGCHVLDADQTAREVVMPGTPGLQALVVEFGKEVLTADGTLDRKRLGAIVFADEEKRQRLNHILHPFIIARQDEILAANTQDVERASDAGLALTTDASGNVFVAGYANSAMSSGVSYAGGADATLVKLDADGNTVWNKQFGSAGDDFARAVLVDNAGSVYVAAESGGRAVVRKYDDADLTQDPVWEADLGAFTGGRRDQLRGLRWSDVDFAGARITFARAMSAGEEASTTKSRRLRVVPLAERTERTERAEPTEPAPARPTTLPPPPE